MEYELLTGKKPVEYDSQKGNSKEYNQYTAEQELWDDKLRSEEPLFVITASFSVSIDALNRRIKLIVDDVQFIDGNKDCSISVLQQVQCVLLPLFLESVRLV